MYVVGLNLNLIISWTWFSARGWVEIGGQSAAINGSYKMSSPPFTLHSLGIKKMSSAVGMRLLRLSRPFLRVDFKLLRVTRIRPETGWKHSQRFVPQSRPEQ